MKFSAKKAAKRFGVAAFLFFFIKGLIWLAVFFGLAKLIFPGKDLPPSEALTVWIASAADTNERVLNFKMLIPETIQDTATIKTYGREHLQKKISEKETLSIQLCLNCEIETDETLEKSIKEKGYAVF